MLGLFTCLGLLALLAAGTLRRPSIAVAGVLCIYGIKQWGQDSSTWLVEHRTVANIAIAVLVLIGLLRAHLGQSSSRAPLASGAWLLGIALYAYAFVTLIWVPNFDQALEQWRLWAPYVVTIAIAAPLLVRDTADVHRVLLWTLLVGGTICLLTLFFGQWGTRGLLLVGDTFEQETNPLAISELAGTVGLVALLALVGPGGAWRKLACVPLIPIALAVIIRSGTRGQLAAFAVAALLGVPLASPRRHFGTWVVVALAAVLIGATGFWIWDHLEVAKYRWTEELTAQDVEGRLAMATTLLGYAVADPRTIIFGLGNSSAFHYIGIYPHITFLEVLAEEGVIGAVLYGGIIIAALRSVNRLSAAARARSDRPLHHAFAVLTTLLLFELVVTSKQGALLSSSYMVAYAAILGRLRGWAESSDRASAAPASAAQSATSGTDPGLVQAFPNLMQ